MKKRSVFFGVATAAFCCAAVLFLVGIGQVLGFIPRGDAGYLDSSCLGGYGKRFRRRRAGAGAVSSLRRRPDGSLRRCPKALISGAII